MSKYQPLTQHLQSFSGDSWHASFADVERVLGFALPRSAREYPAWWANQDPTHSQASGWLGAGWQTSDLNLLGARITFYRSDARLEQRPCPPPAVVRSSTDENDKPQARRVSDDVALQVHFSWKAIGHVTQDHQQRLTFPATKPVPGLYRFHVVINDHQTVYIGETENLTRRFGHYRNPGPSQQTNLRLNAWFCEILSGGAMIAVATVTDGAFLQASDNVLRTADLTSKPVRMLIESAALVDASGQADVALLNR